MATFDISGNYMTSWLQPDGKTYIPGPVVIDAGTQTISVNRVNIANPSFSTASGITTVSWASSDNNPSSAKLTFYQNNGVNGFTGTFAQGSDPAPSSNNLFGNAGTATKQLSTWNGTYACYSMSQSGQSTKMSESLVVGAPSVTFGGTAVANPVYTGEAGPNGEIDQLAWFTADGNAQNVILQFATSTTGSSGEHSTFYGELWTSGAQPTYVNFTGSDASIPSPPTITVIAALVMISNTTAQATTTEVTTEVVTEVTTEVITEVTTEVVTEVATDVIVEVIAAEDSPSKPGSTKLAAPSADRAAAQDLLDKALRLAAA